MGSSRLSDTPSGTFSSVLDRLATQLPGLLGDNLVGIYLYGSVRDPSFVPSRSDIDCIAVTTRPLDDRMFVSLQDWFADALGRDPSFLRLQMSFLTKHRVLEDDPSACLYQFGNLTRSGSDGNPIIWLDFFQRGATLAGPDPRSFVPRITSSILEEALAREVRYLDDEIRLKKQSEWRDRVSYRAYAVLTLCRILYSSAMGEITSKTKAATWTLANAPERFHVLIRKAERVNMGEETDELPLGAIEDLIAHVQSEVAGRRAGK